VARRPDPEDGRQILIELTDRGGAILAEDRARREGWLATVIEADLTPDEQQVLLEAIEILRRLAES
jgi:DNA-binding MarR family transcriptional regulator